MGTDYSRYFSEVLPGLFLGRFPRFTWGRFQGFFQGGSRDFFRASFFSSFVVNWEKTTVGWKREYKSKNIMKKIDKRRYSGGIKET